MISRRAFAAAIAALPSLRALPEGLRIGVTDWNLKLAGKLEAIDLAKSIGFEGVEVSLGRKPVDGKLPLDNPALQREYRDKAKAANIVLTATCLDILHVNYLKNDKLGQRWVADGIRATNALGVRTMLLPFFGNGRGALETQAEHDYVADVLKELAPAARKASVVLALENTLSAADNARILERAKSEAVKVFYDPGNSAPRGFDVYSEIRWLGRDRIAHIHLKDNPGFLGEGKIDHVRILDALREIGYRGFADLETSSPTGDIAADMRKNLMYIRNLR